MLVRRFRVLGCAVLALGVVACVAAYAVRRGSAEAHPSAEAIQQQGGGQALICHEPLRHFQETTEQKLQHAFTLKNASEAPLRITRIGKSCACMEFALGTNVLRPEESTTLGVTLYINTKEPAHVVTFREQLLVHSTGADEPLILQLAGSYLPDLYTFDTRINLPAPKDEGETVEGRTEVFVNKLRGISITDIRADVPFPVATRIATTGPIGNGTFEKVVIAVRGTRPKELLPLQGRLYIRTNSTNQPLLNLPVHLFSPEPDAISFSPSRIAFGMVQPGDKVNRVVSLWIRRDAQLAVESVSTTCEAVSAEILHVQSGRDRDLIQIRCALDASKLLRDADGTLTVLVSGRTSPRTVVLPISAFLKEGPGR